MLKNDAYSKSAGVGISMNYQHPYWPIGILKLVANAIQD